MIQAVSVTIKPVSMGARQLLLSWTQVPLQPQGRANNVTKDSMIHALSFPIRNEAQLGERLFPVPCKNILAFCKSKQKSPKLCSASE